MRWRRSTAERCLVRGTCCATTVAVLVTAAGVAKQPCARKVSGPCLWARPRVGKVRGIRVVGEEGGARLQPRHTAPSISNLISPPFHFLRHRAQPSQPQPNPRYNSSFRSSPTEHPPTHSAVNHESARVLGPRHHWRHCRHRHHTHGHARSGAPVPEDTQVHAEARGFHLGQVVAHHLARICEVTADHNRLFP
jgi:hypothetical protein